MSTTEALRTWLDALQAQLYELQVANRKLREQNPQAQQLLELEELRQSREENVRFVQEISESGQGQAGGSYVLEEDPAVQAELSQTKEANSR